MKKMYFFAFLSMVTFGAFAQIDVVTNGNVGIGTTTPDSKLHVDGDVIIGDRDYGFQTKLYFRQNNNNDDGWSLGAQSYVSNHFMIYSYEPGAHFKIYTDTFERMVVRNDGSVGIGTTDTFGYRLAVNGNGAFKDEVDASEFRVYTGGSNTIGNAGAALNWPDYVFKTDYDLLPLKEVEQHIKEKGHLPNIPSEKEVQEKGSFSLGEMTKKLLEKVEELTLYTIQQNKQLEKQEKRIKALEAKLTQKKG